LYFAPAILIFVTVSDSHHPLKLLASKIQINIPPTIVFDLANNYLLILLMSKGGDLPLRLMVFVMSICRGGVKQKRNPLTSWKMAKSCYILKHSVFFFKGRTNDKTPLFILPLLKNLCRVLVPMPLKNVCCCRYIWCHLCRQRNCRPNGP
jgi:hypothetical protein